MRHCHAGRRWHVWGQIRMQPLLESAWKFCSGKFISRDQCQFCDEDSTHTALVDASSLFTFTSKTQCKMSLCVRGHLFGEMEMQMKL